MGRPFEWLKGEGGRLLTLSKLQEVREGYPLTVGELAEKSGVPRSTIVRLENLDRDCRPPTALKLAKALDTTIPALGQPAIRLFPKPGASERTRKRREREEKKRQEAREQVSKGLGDLKEHPLWGPLVREEGNRG
jgi:transcriptional regulator with XRE-family HTH domain